MATYRKIFYHHSTQNTFWVSMPSSELNNSKRDIRGFLCRKIIRGEKNRTVHAKMLACGSGLLALSAGWLVSAQVQGRSLPLAYIIFCAIQNKINKLKTRVWPTCQSNMINLGADGFSSGFFLPWPFWMCGYCSSFVMFLKGPTNLHSVPPVSHRQADFSSQNTNRSS